MCDLRHYFAAKICLALIAPQSLAWRSPSLRQAIRQAGNGAAIEVMHDECMGETEGKDGRLAAINHASEKQARILAGSVLLMAVWAGPDN
jgi:hypothetical protein